MGENRRLREELRGRFRVENLVGAHGSMQEVFRIVHKVARSTSTVLIYGESGTGKELVARAIHVTSDRRDRPFVAVNVAALPETILEAELFGYEKGAFTGADARKIGLFEHASGSTLFLDEVGELKRDLQVKLLRALQEREMLRVGGTEPVPVDVRVIAATNRDLEREVREGRFREDLFYRLNVIPIALPPLRERRTDIPLLVEHFLAKHGEPGRAQADRTRGARGPRRLLLAGQRAGARVGRSSGRCSWPRATSSRLDDLPAAVRGAGRAPPGGLPIEIPDEGLDLDGLERSLILRALDKTGGNVTRAGPPARDSAAGPCSTASRRSRVHRMGQRVHRMGRPRRGDLRRPAAARPARTLPRTATSTDDGRGPGDWHPGCSTGGHDGLPSRPRLNQGVLNI